MKSSDQCTVLSRLALLKGHHSEFQNCEIMTTQSNESKKEMVVKEMVKVNEDRDVVILESDNVKVRCLYVYIPIFYSFNKKFVSQYFI